MLTRLAQSLVAVTLFIAPPAVSAATDDPFVVHEWGTFTTVQGADGEQIWWQPPASVDLPDFVYRAAVGGDDRPVTFNPKDLSALARMETPVIYFYSQRERVADVRVLFRGGNLTEWYPQPTRVAAAQGIENGLYTTPARDTRQFTIEWNGVKILARDTREMALDKLIRSKAGAGDHYYIARETDANFLRIAAPQARSRVEHERDLFYRGLGYFRAPLAVSMDTAGQLSLTALEAEQISGMFVIEIQGELMRYQKLDFAASSAAANIDPNTQPLGLLGDVRKLVMRDMARALVGAGLYEKEANAVVSTWQDQWFAEQGTRVLYLLPRAWTDRTLQLQVTPQPDSVARVMVGRAELITPSVERELKKQILTYRDGNDTAKSRAVAAVRALRLGRFQYAAFDRVNAGEKDQAFFSAAQELSAASAREDGRSARN